MILDNDENNTELRATSSLEPLPFTSLCCTLPYPFLRCDLPWLWTCWAPLSALLSCHLCLHHVFTVVYLSPFLSFAGSSLHFGTMYLHVCLSNVCLFWSFMVHYSDGLHVEIFFIRFNKHLVSAHKPGLMLATRAMRCCYCLQRSDRALWKEPHLFIHSFFQITIVCWMLTMCQALC